MPAKKTTILVVDDDVPTLRCITRSLEAERYEVVTARDGLEALERVETKEPDLVLLDLMTPKLNGFEVCESIRAFSALPIMVLAARGQVEDKTCAFDLGADDYLTKPFSLVELLARVRALLRRSQWSPAANGRQKHPNVTIGDVFVDLSQREVRVGGRLVRLTPIEYRILAYLIQNAGLVLIHDLLLEHVWGGAYIGETHLLTVNIHRLRNKIEADPSNPRYVISKPGIGYMFQAEPALFPEKKRLSAANAVRALSPSPG